ncbi:MAG: hypothetical protein R3B90_08015 [Planctomycetaceae bacterium]
MSIEAERRMVGPELWVVLLEADEPFLGLVGDTVVVGVTQKLDRAGRCYDRPVPPRDEAGRERQAACERDRVGIATVAIGIAENADAAATRLPVSRTMRVVGVLDDPQPAPLVKGDMHGVDHVRLGRDEFNAAPGMQRELRLRNVRFEWRGGWCVVRDDSTGQQQHRDQETTHIHPLETEHDAPAPTGVGRVVQHRR